MRVTDYDDYLSLPLAFQKQELALGERKSIATDRVIQIPGPPHEVRTVKDIYRMFVSEELSLCAIAPKLNNNGVPRPGHSKWDYSGIRTILTHPKYIGSAVFGRVSKKLHTAVVNMPESDWIVRPGAFEPLVDPVTFAEAQKMIRRHRCDRKDEELLAVRGATLLFCVAQFISEIAMTPRPSES